MRIENPDERRFYEIEAKKENWGYRWLQRQYAKKVDKDGLAAVKDFKEVVGLSVAVGHGEVDSLGEAGLLCAKTCAENQ